VFGTVLWFVVVRCSVFHSCSRSTGVLRCVAVCCRELQRAAKSCSILHLCACPFGVLLSVAVTVLQRVAVYYSVLHCVAVSKRASQTVAESCSE